MLWSCLKAPVWLAPNMLANAKTKLIPCGATNNNQNHEMMIVILHEVLTASLDAAVQAVMNILF